jgi:hypothetical protein
MTDRPDLLNQALCERRSADALSTRRFTTAFQEAA